MKGSRFDTIYPARVLLRCWFALKPPLDDTRKWPTPGIHDGLLLGTLTVLRTAPAVSISTALSALLGAVFVGTSCAMTVTGSSLADVPECAVRLPCNCTQRRN